jgi:hypothetical protein
MGDDVKTAKRKPGEHGALPLSKRTRQRLLVDLLQRAESGDIAAAAELIKLGIETEECAA